jgi:hypothetical protein
LKLADGGLFKGNFVNDVIDGKGLFKWPDGRVYDGEWANNMKHGNGTLKWPDQVAQYTGQFQNDKRDGYGEYTYNYGSRKFVGYW